MTYCHICETLDYEETHILRYATVTEHYQDGSAEVMELIYDGVPDADIMADALQCWPMNVHCNDW